MKISDIAKKLSISIKEVRDKAKELDFAIAQKSQTLSDKKAKEFIEKIQHSRKQELPKEEVRGASRDRRRKTKRSFYTRCFIS